MLASPEPRGRVTKRSIYKLRSICVSEAEAWTPDKADSTLHMYLRFGVLMAVSCSWQFKKWDQGLTETNDIAYWCFACSTVPPPQRGGLQVSGLPEPISYGL